MLPHLVGGEELGGCWGTLGRDGPSRVDGEGVRLDCLSCNASVSCKMLSQMCGN